MDYCKQTIDYGDFVLPSWSLVNQNSLKYENTEKYHTYIVLFFGKFMATLSFLIAVAIDGIEWMYKIMLQMRHQPFLKLFICSECNSSNILLPFDFTVALAIRPGKYYIFVCIASGPNGCHVNCPKYRFPFD